jgi:hypothetical protein
MIGPLGLGYLLWAGVATLAAGIALLALRGAMARLDADASLSRALIVSAAALFVSDFAVAQDQTWLWWLSGFAVCAALHRWFDAVTPSAGTPPAGQPNPSPPSQPKPSKPKAKNP